MDEFTITITDHTSGKQLAWSMPVLHAPYYIGLLRSELGTPVESMEQVPLTEAVHRVLERQASHTVKA